MARLPYLEPSDLGPDDQDLLARPINLSKLLAYSPGGARAFSKLGGWIRFKSRLDPRLREMAILRVGVLTQNAYEFSHHVKLGLEFGLTDDDVRAVVTGPAAPDLTDVEQLLLRATDEATVDGAMTDATVAALRQELGDEQTVELNIIVGFYNGVVRLLASLDIDVEDDYQPYLDRHPLPGDDHTAAEAR